MLPKRVRFRVRFPIRAWKSSPRKSSPAVGWCFGRQMGWENQSQWPVSEIYHEEKFYYTAISPFYLLAWAALWLPARFICPALQRWETKTHWKHLTGSSGLEGKSWTETWISYGSNQHSASRFNLLPFSAWLRQGMKHVAFQRAHAAVVLSPRSRHRGRDEGAWAEEG